MTTSSVNTNPSQAIYAQLNQGSSISSSSSSSSSSSTSATSASSLQNEFLTLLTTQLKNQDPTNPLDSAQLTSQLAQISTVDGIQQLNATLQTLLSNMGSSQSMQAASLVGQAVLVPGSTLSLTSNGAVGGLNLSSNADNVVVKVQNANGQTVKTLNLGSMNSGVNEFAWDGTTDSGGTVATGNYTFTIAATQGQNKVTASALAMGSVSSISPGSGTTATTVNVAGLGSYPLSNVMQIF
jgi:flagellar basal-body rod modification protein FlgD